MGQENQLSLPAYALLPGGMKISELMARLDALRDEHGDLDCVVYPLSGIEPVRQPRARVIQEFDFGHLGNGRTGDRVIVVWSKV